MCKLILPRNSLPYYEKVLEVMPQARDFVAYYPVPGMGHCGGGVGCGNVDWFTPLVNWVEKGIEPGALEGMSTNSLYPTRTRPICRYPEVARWDGTDSQNDWTSFSCVPPIEVRIEPEILDLDSRGEFTAIITVPKGFDVRDWHIHDVLCEGASAVEGRVFWDAYIAKFRTRDLKERSPGQSSHAGGKLSFSA